MRQLLQSMLMFVFLSVSSCTGSGAKTVGNESPNNGSDDDTGEAEGDAGNGVTRDAAKPGAVGTPGGPAKSDAGKATATNADGGGRTGTASDAAILSNDGDAGGGPKPGEGSDAGGGSVDLGGLDPIIPEIMGECPTIKEGTSTVSVMGLKATVIAGAQKAGTGSLLIYYYGTGTLGDVSFLPAAIKTDIASEGGIVFALNEAKNTGGDCSGTGTFGIDDFNVVDQFVACAVKNYGINPKRIYATGCSAGGLTSGCMGIMRSNYIAAVAPNSGGVTIGYSKIQDPKRVPNAITMNGGSGDNVIVNFGETSEGYDNYILKAGGFAVNCVHNGGHCGASAELYQSAWQFLKDHPFGTKPSPYAGGLPSGFDSTCKVFTMTDRAPLGGY